MCYNKKNVCSVYHQQKAEGGPMAVLTSQATQKKELKSKFNDEFEKYLKRQCLKTTFNGLELETFSWYKKMLGLI